MRYGWGFVAWLLIAAPAHAAPVSFAIDLVFPAFGGIGSAGQELAIGPMPNAGLVTFEDILGIGETVVPFESVQFFSLEVLLTDIDPGLPDNPPQSFGGVLVGGSGPVPNIFKDPNSICESPVCGFRFSGRQFTGFEGFLRQGVGFNFTDDVVLPVRMFDSLGAGTATLRELASAAPVPEPSTWAILALGGLLAGRAYRKRTTRRAEGR
jgi:hypothetical protein